MKRHPKLLILMLALAGLTALAYGPIERRVLALELLRSMASEDRKEAPAPGSFFEGIVLPNGTKVRARVYGPPESRARHTIILVHGIHHLGIDEPRLIRFARHLAQSGCRVLTPEIRDLADYRVTKDSVPLIRASVEHLAHADAKVGLIGFSFAGGLSLLAATDSATAARLKYVASVGGYHDLHRSLRFLATHQVEGPSGREARRAHEYGLLVLLYQNLQSFDLKDDLIEFRAALKSWLMEDRSRAREHARTLGSEKARSLFRLVERQQVGSLSDKLLALLHGQEEMLRELSPAGKLEQVRTAVLFLHGAGDRVVPPEETEFAKLELGRVGHPNYHVLITPLLFHVRVEHPGDYKQKWALVTLVSRLL